MTNSDCGMRELKNEMKKQAVEPKPEMRSSAIDLIQDRIKDLRENTDFVLTLFESLIGYAIVAADFDGNIIAYNEGAHQIYGYTPEEIIGKENIEIFFPRAFIEAGELQRIINDLIGKGRYSYEGEKVRKGGEGFPAQVLFTLTRDRNGKVVGFIEIVEDLTERKRAEEALAASKAYTESIIQNFLDTLIVVDKEAKIQTMNPATIHLLGYAEEELIEKPVSAIFAEEEEEEEEVHRLFQFFHEPENAEPLRPQDTIRNRELTYKTKDGQLIPMLFNASVLTDEADNVTGVVAGAKDITELKLAEAELRKEKTFSENIIATVPDSLLVLDSNLRIKSANRTFYETFRTEPETVIGTRITKILDDKDGKLGTELTNLFGTEDILENFDLHYQSEKLGERIFDIRARGIIVGTEEEELLVIEDITERKRAEEAQAQAQAQQIEQMERELRSLELLAHPPPVTAVTAQLFDAAPLSASLPDTFDELVVRYGELMDQALEQRAYKVDYDISGNLRSMAERMGFVKAGPRDVVKLHSTVLQRKTGEVPSAKARAYLEEGRLMLLELMGYLVSFYRNYSLGSKEVYSPEEKMEVKKEKGGT